MNVYFSFVYRYRWIAVLLSVLILAGIFFVGLFHPYQSQANKDHPLSSALKLSLEITDQKLKHNEIIATIKKIIGDQYFVRIGELGREISNSDALYLPMSDLFWYQEEQKKYTKDPTMIFPIPDNLPKIPSITTKGLDRAGRPLPLISGQEVDVLSSLQYTLDFPIGEYTVLTENETNLEILVKNKGSKDLLSEQIYLITQSPYRYNSPWYVPGKWIGESVVMKIPQNIASGKELKWSFPLKKNTSNEIISGISFGLALKQGDEYFPIQGEYSRISVIDLIRPDTKILPDTFNGTLPQIQQNWNLPKYFHTKKPSEYIMYILPLSKNEPITQHHQSIQQKLSAIEQKGFSLSLKPVENVNIFLPAQDIAFLEIIFFVLSALLLSAGFFFTPSLVILSIHFLLIFLFGATTWSIFQFFGSEFTMLFTAFSVFCFSLFCLYACLIQKKYLHYDFSLDRLLGQILPEIFFGLIWIPISFVFPLLLYLQMDALREAVSLVMMIIAIHTLLLLLYPALLSILWDYQTHKISMKCFEGLFFLWKYKRGKIISPTILAILLATSLIAIIFFVFSHRNIFVNPSQGIAADHILDYEQAPLIFENLSEQQERFILQELRKKPFIAHIESPQSFLPDDQNEKIAILKSISRSDISYTLPKESTDQAFQKLIDSNIRCAFLMKKQTILAQEWKPICDIYEKITKNISREAWHDYHQKWQNKMTTIAQYIQVLPEDLRPVSFENIPIFLQKFLKNENGNTVFVYPKTESMSLISLAQIQDLGRSLSQTFSYKNTSSQEWNLSMQDIFLLFCIPLFFWIIRMLISGTNTWILLLATLSVLIGWGCVLLFLLPYLHIVLAPLIAIAGCIILFIQQKITQYSHHKHLYVYDFFLLFFSLPWILLSLSGNRSLEILGLITLLSMCFYFLIHEAWIHHIYPSQSSDFLHALEGVKSSFRNQFDALFQKNIFSFPTRKKEEEALAYDLSQKNVQNPFEPVLSWLKKYIQDMKTWFTPIPQSTESMKVYTPKKEIHVFQAYLVRWKETFYKWLQKRKHKKQFVPEIQQKNKFTSEKKSFFHSLLASIQSKKQLEDEKNQLNEHIAQSAPQIRSNMQVQHDHESFAPFRFVPIHQSRTKHAIKIELEIGDDLTLEDIEVYMSGNMLHILRVEGGLGMPFERHVEIDDPIDVQNIRLSLKNGDLLVVLPLIDLQEVSEVVPEITEHTSEEEKIHIEESQKQKAIQHISGIHGKHKRPNLIPRKKSETLLAGALQYHIQERDYQLVCKLTLGEIALETLDIRLDDQFIYIRSHPGSNPHIEQTIPLPKKVLPETASLTAQDGFLYILLSLRDAPQIVNLQG